MMDSCDPDRCADCISHYVCTCMKITEDDLIDAIVDNGLRDLHELRQHTGAGDGCMACRRRLQRYVEIYSTGSKARVRVPAVSLEMVG